MKLTPDGGWVLNPETAFHLTIYGTNRSQIEQIHRTLESVKDSADDRQLRDLIPMFFQDKCFCREIEDYIEASAPIYIQRFEEAKKNCAEWATAKKRRQNALLKDFHAEAISALDVHPYDGVFGLDLLLNEEAEDDRARAVVQLLSHTYTMAAYAAIHLAQATEPNVLPAVSGWEIFSVGDNGTCKFCDNAPKLFPPQSPPRVPRHLGCRCNLTAVLVYEDRAARGPRIDSL